MAERDLEGKGVLGIYCSPRKGGNSEILLNTVLEGLVSRGANVERIFVRDLKISGCIECGGCDKEGICVVEDDMGKVYPLLEEHDWIIMASPIFFYGMPSQAKALVDRAQALWSKGRLGLLRKRPEEAGGYLLALGATKGKNLFLGIELEARYFYDALGLKYKGGLFFRGVEKKGDILAREDILEEARGFGRNFPRPPAQ